MSKTILIVEDEKSLRNVLRQKLEHENFEVLEATNGQEGLDQAIKNNPDLILLDIVMPVMDGFTMIEQLRNHEHERGILVGNQIPIILLSNLSDQEKFAESQKKGVYDFLVKSDWTLEAVVVKIKNKLGM
ncbi:MAG: response regulator with CheY-like protein receiver domain and winged-helix DNA-binding-like protein [Candidatus Berkelbacteria bacterium]|nr:response regulator with CheY-like protein receiver domain and winged-helix DNA-binding-like protein [Candidatus Berkelbacteria bacterium]